jgi:hypothetical protein
MVKILWWGKDKPEKVPISDETRAQYEETNKIKREIRNAELEIEKIKLEHQREIAMLKMELEKAELQDQLSELTGDQGNEMDPILGAFLQPFLNKTPIQNRLDYASNSVVYPNTTQNSPSMQHAQSLTVDIGESTIQLMIDKIPKNDIKKLKQLSDDQLKDVIKMQYPTISENSLNIAVKIIRLK